ncbi:RuBisCO large subunit C-terminal-like domain-containing protein [Lachnotalea glycerini]|uniref:2,3-diketo-5-methylthiopentyl-1-phosphate enolase n=1 Tax=Lachnotalea glycerini TaxID=1763509 RepID=A0A371JGY4_9FIRM|nr:RuBisCO large subunit C-terminal-like domain-containing protein [Lachnotalea glycerini]RDY31993.1 2,3-diketo-5-methylthiopentyl-1-phosphate enolase [Lachnotalea glycerini]
MKRNYDPIIFCQSESLDLEDFVIATYLMSAQTKDVLMRAGAMAVEQTTGTWLRVPDETDEVRRKFVGRVINVFNVPGYEATCPDKIRTCVIQIAFPWRNFGQQLPELLSTVFGNISIMDNLKLLDLQFPKSFTAGFKGPRFGTQGLRDRLGIQDRPLTLAMIKPCTGIPIDVIERQFYNLALSGVDMVKDDELIADPIHAPLFKRIEACQRAAEKAYKETGKKVLYIPNITDRQDRMFEKAHKAIDMGVEALMVNVHATGYGTMSALAEDDSINVPLLAHPCYSGTSYMGSSTGMSSHIIHGKFMRLEGADMVVYNCSYGKVPSLVERYVRIGQSLLSDFHGLKPTFPSPAAGMHPGLVGQVMDDLGPDIIIGAGASMHAHPMGLKGGVAALNQAAEAWKLNVTPQEYAQDHEELRISIDQWGVYDPNKSIFELTN